MGSPGKHGGKSSRSRDRVSINALLNYDQAQDELPSTVQRHENQRQNRVDDEASRPLSITLDPNPEMKSPEESLQMSQSMRTRWTPEEDRIVLWAIDKYGLHDWDKVAQHLPKRKGQHARLRYHNYLRHSEAALSQPFSEEEDRIILSVSMEDPNKWSYLSTALKRTNHSVKNRYQLLLRRSLKEQRMKERESAGASSSKNMNESASENDPGSKSPFESTKH
uniref:Myb-like domain-containing protein n=1 Tax=Timspurckia oligopyrenoides TaxID=708627 RepID=A0A7S1ER48_9RHOD|mmetsp:Transcript_13380/g.24015  ORF Transcript_13380/g.24015 Transcript_13380/m.24015 type:complete len:222 (+) Transcript_13380:466-1131(+)|eukprot:CAMPEP_0182444868 /NCGR_PEP_ID=MMETSP1172-20130603/3178_1 /TAXON_ID=708627 /ORGANISM="Timspurckia oligopyrenoides, Strain CCMP3278" /LENGTH=221 /DNA_ID=CAMNT_0024640517 /DNA_START=458 /DNA_END=1123 /DNA_ORIENTATION=+